jgi:hypothetical protein
MPSTSLDTVDALELAELLQSIIDWLGSDRQLRRSFAGLVDQPGRPDPGPSGAKLSRSRQKTR